jgi:hypothetical protein
MKHSITLGLVLAAALAGTLGLVGSSAAAPTAASSVTTTSDEGDARCGKCGDNYCSATCGETATSCPRDCGTAY